MRQITLPLDLPGFASPLAGRVLQFHLTDLRRLPQGALASLLFWIGVLIPTASAEIEPPEVGSKWVYQVTAGDQDSVWTRMIAATEAVGGRTANVATSTDASNSMTRDMTDGPQLKIIGGLLYWDRETLDVIRDTAFIEVDGESMKMDRVRLYTNGRHGHPYRENQQWQHDDITTTSAGEEVVKRVVKTYRASVVAEEAVLGWSCHKIEYTLVAVDGRGVDPVVERTEWWSPQVKGEVKVIIHKVRYATEEVRELRSFTLQ